MPNFKKLNTQIYKKSGYQVTADYIYWKKLGTPVLVKEFGPIDYIDFSPIEPHYFAVTCSVRVQVYNPITKFVVKNLSRFRESAYGAVFRYDGKLLCSGSEEGVVKLFDVSTKSLLRLFKGHTSAIHRTFFTYEKPHIVSFSDDKSVKVWDIPTEKDIITYNEHTDYIRAGATNMILPNLILSGGYDNTVNMYDTRTEKVILSVNHESPVESLLFLPTGGIFLSAGGTDIKVWDMIAGGKLLGNISQHHKTITCLRLASDNKRLLSGSLDRHVKIYDISSFNVVHTLDYPNSVLSLGVSKNDDTLVAGLVDGLVAINRREDETKLTTETKISPKNVDFKAVDTIVDEQRFEKFAKYDTHLRKFQYSKALESVLVPYVTNKLPHITISVLQELMRRKALARVLETADKKIIIELLKFFKKYITTYRFTRVLISAINIFIDVCSDDILSLPAKVTRLFYDLITVLNAELEHDDELCALQGAMHMLLAASDVRNTLPDVNEPHNLVPSADAQKNLVLNIN